MSLQQLGNSAGGGRFYSRVNQRYFIPPSWALNQDALFFTSTQQQNFGGWRYVESSDEQ